MEMTEVAETTPPRRGKRRWLGIALAALLLVLALGGVAAALIAMRISSGPMEIEQGRQDALKALTELAGPGGTASLGNMSLEWRAGQGLVFILRDAKVRFADGLTEVELPSVEVSAGAWPLLTGEVAPRAIRVERPLIKRQLDDPRPRDRVAIDVVLETIERALRQPRGQNDTLERIEVVGATVTFSRVIFGYEQRWSLFDVTLVADLDESGGFDTTVSGASAQGRWTLTARRHRDAEGRTTVDVDGADISLVDFAGVQFPGFDMESNFYPAVRLRFGAAGGLELAEGRIGLGAGLVRFGPNRTDRVTVDQAELAVAWRPVERELDVTRLVVKSGDTRFSLNGRVVPPAEPTGDWRVTLIPTEIALLPVGVAGEPILVNRGQLAFLVSPGRALIDIEPSVLSWRVGERDRSLKLSGAVDFVRIDPSLRLQLELSEVDAGDVARLWPIWVAPPARSWFLDNILSGRADAGGRIDLNLPQFYQPLDWPRDAIRLDFSFRDLNVKTLGKLPDVTGGRGRLLIENRQLMAEASSGQITAPAGGRVALSDFRFQIIDTFDPTPLSRIGFDARGDVAALAEIAGLDPFNALEPVGLNASDLSGTAQARIEAEFRLKDPLKPEDVEFAIEADLDRFAARKPIEGRRIENGRLKLTVLPTGTKLAGQARIDGVDAKVDLLLKVGGAGSRAIGFTLDEETFKRLGFGTTDFLDGRVDVTANQVDDGNQATPALTKVEADLTRARLSLPVFGWTKGAGVAAKATFDLVQPRNGTPRIENLVFTSEGLDVRGRLELAADYTPVAARLDRFALRKGDEARLTVQRDGGVLRIGFDAQVFDGRGLMLTAKRGSQRGVPTPDASGQAIDLTLNAARLIGFNGMDLNGASARLSLRDGLLASLDFTGKLNSKAAVTAKMTPSGAGKRSLTVTTDNAGAFLKFADLYGQVAGGRAELSANFTGPGQATGVLLARDFQLDDSAKPRAEQAPPARFEKFVTRYALKDGKIEVDDAVLRGDVQGATAAGTIDLDARRLSIVGTYIPAYRLNNLIARVPILGQIVAGSQEGGIVGVTFALTGPIENPVLEINPMSAIAPGILRKVFEFRDSRDAERSAVPARPPASNN